MAVFKSPILLSESFRLGRPFGKSYKHNKLQYPSICHFKPKLSEHLSRQSREEISSSGRNENAIVTLKVYDVLGREVATLVNKQQAPGSYPLQFNATNLTSGVYFYRLTDGDFVSVKKMILIK